ncbi:hypothetical protein C0992_004063 [Termitomyces sp. T32_za158]|nr:hypothetical protein C0992_004063 [Termitomyces sp. T32_za158]
MAVNTETRAALVFLVLYTILFVLLILGYATMRLRLRSRYTLITLHVAIRLAAQSTGIAFGLLGYSNIGVLIAYFTLYVTTLVLIESCPDYLNRNTEGFFTLVLCAYRFLISWHYHNLAVHDSWLEPRLPPDTPILRRLLDSFSFSGPKRNYMAIMHQLLIAANAIIIAGGSSLSGAQTSLEVFNERLHKAMIMRTIGQSIFLSLTMIFVPCVLYTMWQYRQEQPRGKIHPTTFILLMTWPFLMVRGVYGILSGVFSPFDYFYPGNYVQDGLKDSFVISEYVLSTAMEWTTCSLLMFTYVTSQNDPPKPPLLSWKKENEGLTNA